MSTRSEYEDKFTETLLPLKQPQSTSIASVETRNDQFERTETSEAHNQGTTYIYVNICNA